jgi:acyl-CoA dehydrogenase
MIYEGTSEVQRIIVAGHALGSYEPVMPSMDDLPVTGEPAEGKKAWRCRVCGHVHYGDEPPEKCPYCFMPSGAFKELA